MTNECTHYEICREDFVSFFPEFLGISQEQFCAARKLSNVYVTSKKMDIGLPLDLHILAIKLAIAHCLMKRQDVLKIVEANGGNVDGSMANVRKATEGFVSVDRAIYEPKNAIESDLLSDEPYGVMLLNILNQAQLPVPKYENRIYPYYGSLGYGLDIYPIYTNGDKECQ